VVKSGVIDRMVSHFNLMGNKAVLVTNVVLEHALFPNPSEAVGWKGLSRTKRSSEKWVVCGTNGGRAT
jgi:hypothetical protein